MKKARAMRSTFSHEIQSLMTWSASDEVARPTHDPEIDLFIVCVCVCVRACVFVFACACVCVTLVR